MKYHSDNTNNKYNTDIIITSNYGMNEIDAEASVEWPSWCYAGENSANEDTSAMVKNLSTTTPFYPSSFSQQLKTASIASSLNAIATAAANSQIHKLKGKRKSIISGGSRNKMLSDHLESLGKKKYCDEDSEIPLTEKDIETVDIREANSTRRPTSAMDFFKPMSTNGDSYGNANNNNSLANNNNTNIKDERQSPTQQQQPQDMTHNNSGICGLHLSSSRSRSSTPSSPPGTPPQSQRNDLLESHFSSSLANSLAAGHIKPDFSSSRTYSDQLRNFAAKYNALNEPNNTKNTIYESELNMTSAKSSVSKAPSSPENSKKSNTVSSIRSPVSVPTNNLISTLFSSFSPSTFTSLIDMRGSQLLLSLAQAAKENEFKQHVLNGPSKRIIKRSTPPIHSNPLRLQQSPTSNPTTSPQNRGSNFPNSLQFLSLSQKPPPNHTQPIQTHSVSGRLAMQSNTVSGKQRALSPLDLSASPASVNRFVIGTTDSKELMHLKRKRVSPSPGTGGQISIKRIRSQTPSSDTPNSMQSHRKCNAQSDEINSWTVDEVCEFVNSIDICAGYVENFRDQCIDGSGLPLLTEDHLVNSLNMKLGPALKLRSVLLKKIGGPCPCISCSSLQSAINNSSMGCSIPSPSGSNHRPSSTESGT